MTFLEIIFKSVRCEHLSQPGSQCNNQAQGDLQLEKLCQKLAIFSSLQEPAHYFSNTIKATENHQGLPCIPFAFPPPPSIWERRTKPILPLCAQLLAFGERLKLTSHIGRSAEWKSLPRGQGHSSSLPHICSCRT